MFEDLYKVAEIMSDASEEAKRTLITKKLSRAERYIERSIHIIDNDNLSDREKVRKLKRYLKLGG